MKKQKPKNLTECIQMLDHILKKEDKEKQRPLPKMNSLWKVISR